jgi:hypothetical protein
MGPVKQINNLLSAIGIPATDHSTCIMIDIGAVHNKRFVFRRPACFKYLCSSGFNLFFGHGWEIDKKF